MHHPITSSESESSDEMSDLSFGEDLGMQRKSNRRKLRRTNSQLAVDTRRNSSTVRWSSNDKIAR